MKKNILYILSAAIIITQIVSLSKINDLQRQIENTKNEINNIGLEHRYTVAHWVGGANAQREPWFDDEQIYSVDGRLFRKNEYQETN